MADQNLCISCDSHVVETPEIFEGLEQRFGERAPKIIHIPDKGDVLQVYGPARGRSRSGDSVSPDTGATRPKRSR